MGSIVEFYNGRTGRLLETMELSTHCVYSLQDISKADFEVVVKRNSKAVQSLFTPGNAVVIKKPAYLRLPDWPGIIDDDVDWIGEKIRIPCSSPHILYTWRNAVTMKLTGRTLKNKAGNVIKELIDVSNRAEDLRVRYGKIEIGSEIEETYDAFIYDNIKDIVDKGWDWQFRHGFGTGGGLLFYFDFVKRMGQDLKNISLIEGVNFEKMAGQTILRQVGPIINQLAGASDSSTDEERYTSIQQDLKSIKKYRLRQGSQVFDGVQNHDTVDSHTKDLLSQTKELSNIPAITAQNKNGLFGFIRLGNILKIVYQSAGWLTGKSTGLTDFVRIMVMDHSDATPDKIGLTAISET